MAIDYIPTRVQILAAQTLEQVLTDQGKPVPDDVREVAAWAMDDAWNSRRRVAAREAAARAD